MRVHRAVWVFAQSFGNDYARAYASRRNTMPDALRDEKDSKFLLRSGGIRLRNMWDALSIEDREKFMLENPDESFPKNTTGILDERTAIAVQARPSKQRRTGRVHSDAQPSQKKQKKTAKRTKANGNEAESSRKTTKPTHQSGGAALVDRMLSARADYHKVAYKEHLLQLEASYNQGSLYGVVSNLVASVKHAILNSRATRPTGAADEVYSAVACQVTDVFDSALATISKAPEVLEPEEQPSIPFSNNRIAGALGRYQDLRTAIESRPVDAKLHFQPEAILQPTHRYFGDIPKSSR